MLLEIKSRTIGRADDEAVRQGGEPDGGGMEVKAGVYLAGQDPRRSMRANMQRISLSSVIKKVLMLVSLWHREDFGPQALVPGGSRTRGRTRS